MTTRVIGLDLSLTCTGLVIADGKRVGVRLIRSKPLGTALIDRKRRLQGIADGIWQSWERVPDLVVVEAPIMAAASRSSSGSAHDRSGLWWRIVDTLIAGCIPVLEVPPACRAKYATGKGNASKGAVIDAVARRYPDVPTGGDDNLADALILAAIGRRLLADPLEDSLPAANLAALIKIRLPEGVTA